MPLPRFDSGFLRSTPARILTVLLLIQAALLYGFGRSEMLPVHQPLNQAPDNFGSWFKTSEGVIEQEIKDILKADDLLNRSYTNVTLQKQANLFVAFFKSQRTGQAPHSPKNCLPGSGWVPSVSDTLTIAVPGRAEPVTVNRYIVARGDEKSLVLYWYQSRDRVVASEYSAKYYVVADALRYNRTDTALVRVVVPAPDGDTGAAELAAVDFVKSFFLPLRQHFPLS